MLRLLTHPFTQTNSDKLPHRVQALPLADIWGSVYFSSTLYYVDWRSQVSNHQHGMDNQLQLSSHSQQHYEEQFGDIELI